jgi:alanine racemase
VPEATTRPAWAEVDLGAIRHNVRTLAELCDPAIVCAVVKADGYGHGAVPVARAALEAGARWLAVAVVEEGLALRNAGVRSPILLLSEPPADAMADALHARLTLTLYTAEGVEQADAAARRDASVHLKVDTGMHRVGADPDAALELATAVAKSRWLRLEGLWTHLAVADQPEDAGYTAGQLERFENVRDELAAAGLQPDVLHTANSAAAIAHPSTRYDMVRCGIAVYGHAPSPALAGRAPLQPALSLKARVTHVRELDAGEALSYGLRYQLAERSVVATVPLGYADGVARRLAEHGGEVLIGGRRRPISGTITMDQLLVDCGPGAAVEVGDEVVLIGEQGEREITAEEWAERLGTISYEVLSRIGPRVPRVHVG